MKVKVFLTLVVLVAMLVGAFWVYVTSEFTQCFADFPQRGKAERAAAIAGLAGVGTDVEPSGPGERDHNSRGGSGISVTFSDGETGEDAGEFLRVFRHVVRVEDGNLGHPGGCLERPPFN